MPKKVGPRDAADSGVAVGDRHPVDQDEANDLAEGERDDGEIIAAQPQHGKAEHQAPQRREHAGKRQEREEGEAEFLGDQRIGIGSDRVEGDIAEIEQPGQADDDVEAEAQHHIDQNLDAEIIDPFHRALRARQRQREHGIDDHEADRERRKPAAERAPKAHRRGARFARFCFAARAPRGDDERIDQAAGDDEPDEREQERPARLDRELVADVLGGAQPDQREKQAEGKERGDGGVLESANEIDAGCSAGRSGAESSHRHA